MNEDTKAKLDRMQARWANGGTVTEPKPIVKRPSVMDLGKAIINSTTMSNMRLKVKEVIE